MLTKERKGEIAYTILKLYLRKKRIHLDSANWEIGNVAKAAGIPASDLREFARAIKGEVLAEIFGSAAE